MSAQHLVALPPPKDIKALQTYALLGVCSVQETRTSLPKGGKCNPPSHFEKPSRAPGDIQTGRSRYCEMPQPRPAQNHTTAQQLSPSPRKTRGLVSCGSEKAREASGGREAEDNTHDPPHCLPDYRRKSQSGDTDATPTLIRDVLVFLVFHGLFLLRRGAKHGNGK